MSKCTFHLMRNVSFASFTVRICSDSSVAFRLLAFREECVVMPVPRTILFLLPLLPSFGRPRSLEGIYHQVGILPSSCSCSSGHDFGLGSLLYLRVSVCYVMQ